MDTKLMHWTSYGLRCRKMTDIQEWSDFKRNCNTSLGIKCCHDQNFRLEFKLMEKTYENGH